MAVAEVSQYRRYIGTSSERDSLAVTGIPTGSTFFESDTGLLYIFDGTETWTKKVYPAPAE